MSVEPKSVSEIIGEIKRTIEGTFNSICVIGEVTNLSKSGSGHIYFSLMDKESMLNCCLFRMDVGRNPEAKNIKNGDLVTCFGQTGVYAKRGSFQLIVKRIKAAGKGDLKAQFEKIKRKLAADGLFDLEHKVVIPSFPKRVFVMTAKSGAALSDFLNIMERRSVWMDIVLVPVLVQGDKAPGDIIKGFDLIEKYAHQNPGKAPSVVVLTRGGGSMEDLWAFNDSNLAARIFNFPFPLISAIGHQVDTTICDYVADLRAETPSAAAELITGGSVNLKQRLVRDKQALLSEARRALGELHNKKMSSNPTRLVSILKGHLLDFENRLQICKIENRALELIGIHEFSLRLDEAYRKLDGFCRNLLEGLDYRLKRSNDLLNALGPKNVLERGYSYTTNTKGKLISNTNEAKSLKENEHFNIHYHDGVVKVKTLDSL